MNEVLRTERNAVVYVGCCVVLYEQEARGTGDGQLAVKW